MYYLIIAYDTPDDKRRNRMVKVIKRYGERRQYSLFEARVTRVQYASLKRELSLIIDEEEDNVAIYFLSPENLKKAWRIGNQEIKPLHEPDFV